MPQSLAGIYLHLIWSTKLRAPIIPEQIRARLHAYMMGIHSDLECTALAINSRPDHVHVLCRLSRTVSVAQLLEEVKKASSRWLNQPQNGGLRNFHWQTGYAAFSVSSSQVNEVIAYIHDQEKHHKTTTFQDEYRAFLNKYGVAFDEQYVWD